MFSYSSNQSFVDTAIQEGKIYFKVRGSLQCDFQMSFKNFGIVIHPPTSKLRAYAQETKDSELQKVHVTELQDEVVFSGSIDLAENSKQGIDRALGALELWADFLCFASGNPKVTIEIELPVQAVISIGRHIDEQIGKQLLEAAGHFHFLDPEDKSRVLRALWWYRKGCNTAYYSVFDSYTSYWNCLEILCDVSGSKMRQDADLDEAIDNYLKGKKSFQRGHILQCYNQFVNYSIASQIKDALVPPFGPEQASRWAYYLFDQHPESERLYQIRNDINHGNIQENDALNYERVYLSHMLLGGLVSNLLHYHLGRRIEPGDVDKVAKSIFSSRDGFSDANG
jgi:hypothetical protein